MKIQKNIDVFNLRNCSYICLNLIDGIPALKKWVKIDKNQLLQNCINIA